MASNRQGSAPRVRRCTDVAKELRCEALKLDKANGQNKYKPQKAEMAKADVVKGGCIGLKDGTVGVITHAAVADKKSQ